MPVRFQVIGSLFLGDDDLGDELSIKWMSEPRTDPDESST
jgi:hypothetical protein